MSEPTNGTPLGQQYPAAPTVEMRAAAIGLRQLYTALSEEGFTEYQALTILGQMLFLGRSS